MMKRIPEPDLMNDAAQALAYANADFSGPNALFINLFQQTFSHTNISGQVLDLGCGPADITIRFANNYPRCLITGVDGSKNMLKHGRLAVKNTALIDRIDLICGYLPKAKLPQPHYNVIISNSLLHHLTDPMILWDVLEKNTDSSTSIFIMDLIRPESIKEAQRLVDQYAPNEPEILREDFFNSFCASYRMEEVVEQLRLANLSELKVKPVSDRHFIVYGNRF